MKTYWVLIPPWVMADEELSESQKILCGVVNGLTRERGYCFASNEYLGNYLGKSERTISRALKELQRAGYITIDNPGNRNRRIAVTLPNATDNLDKNGGVTSPKTSTYSKSDELRDNSIVEVFHFWVDQRRKALKARGPNPKLSKKRKGKVSARLDDGYSVKDLKEAILGMLSNDFNIQGGFTDIELACRSAQKVDQYMAWHRHGRPKETRRERWDDVPPEPKEWE